MPFIWMDDIIVCPQRERFYNKKKFNKKAIGNKTASSDSKLDIIEFNREEHYKWKPFL